MRCAIHAMALVAAGVSAPALAQTAISVTISGTLSSVGEPSIAALSGSLDGANFIIDGTIAGGATYVDGLGAPAAVFEPGATMTLTNAATASLNGLYDLSPAAFFPTFSAFLADPGLGGFFDPITATKGSTTLTVSGIFLAGPGAFDAAIGGPVLPSHFSVLSTTGFEIFTDTDLFTSDSLSISATFVPSPGPLAVAAVGGLAVSRRRR